MDQLMTNVYRDVYDNLKSKANMIDIDVRPKNFTSSNRKLTDIKAKMGLLFNQPGIYSNSKLNAAGFTYTNEGDAASCKHCGLKISDWKFDMDPFTTHSNLSPNCSFVLSLKSPSIITSSSSFSSPIFSSPSSSSSSYVSSSSPSTAVIRSVSISGEQENPSKRQKTESNLQSIDSSSLFEVEKTQQIRRRTFSHWPHRSTPSQSQMIEAGFYNCNVGDRVICIYCNLICQQWTPHTDDPCEVHKTLSPNCIYVKAKLVRRETGTILIVNETGVGAAAGSQSIASNGLDQFRCNEFVHTAACNAAYSELPKRTASFNAWPSENMPPVDDLVKAGFFFTGTKNIVTCFYCNGSLQNWGPNDNPTIEHARWFPHCAYAKQLCGDELYRKIQESKRAQQERARANESKDKSGSAAAANVNTTSSSRQLMIPDESTLSRLVAARLDLPVSQNLLSKNFKLSIIKRCWEDQLRLKHDDFASDCDLFMACLILQKQIEHIDGKKENIIIPSIKMKKLRDEAEKQRAEALAREQAASAVPQSCSTEANNTDAEMTLASQSATNESTSSTDSTSQTTSATTQEETNAKKSSTTKANEQHQTDESSPANPCVLCLTEEKRLACIPCGHLATCVPCGHSLRSCPICRREIEAFVRIYV